MYACSMNSDHAVVPSSTLYVPCQAMTEDCKWTTHKLAMASHVQAEDADKAKSAPTRAAAGPQLEQDEGDDLDPSQYHERRLRCAGTYIVQHIFLSAIVAPKCLHLNIPISSITRDVKEVSCVESEAVLQSL